MFTIIICPVSTVKVDSHISRLTVFLNVLLMVYFLFTVASLAILVVAIDYGIRAMGYNQYSPICFIASLIIRISGMKAKMVDKAPKIFASRLGFICATLGFIFITAQLTFASILIVSFFVVLATLDSVFDFCVGCMIYNYLVFPFFNKA
ncbi:MAG: DUF4395 domain-containing protein [Saprospiraceae bacterium]|nr:DUF4395 domain-containing protein [Saprospiraceae bacterium]